MVFFHSGDETSYLTPYFASIPHVLLIPPPAAAPALNSPPTHPRPTPSRVQWKRKSGCCREAPRGASFISLGATCFRRYRRAAFGKRELGKLRWCWSAYFNLKRKTKKDRGLLVSSCACKFPLGASMKAGSWLLHLPGSRIRATACFFRPRRESYSPEKTSRDF